MPETDIDLWPSDIGTSDIRPPVAILREQATLLASKTNGLVEAEVATRADDETIVHSFMLVAPVLDRYRYHLFTMYHPVTLYPIRVRQGTKWLEIESEDQLLEALKSILSSEQTIGIVRALVAQSKA
jgi:hypothetical protein